MTNKDWRWEKILRIRTVIMTMMMMISCATEYSKEYISWTISIKQQGFIALEHFSDNTLIRLKPVKKD